VAQRFEQDLQGWQPRTHPGCWSGEPQSGGAGCGYTSL